MTEQKKTFTGTIKKSNDSEFDGTFVLSSEDLDRDGDIISLDGWELDNFKKNPIALWQHDHKQPVGVWHNIRKEAGALVADLKTAGTNLGRMAQQLIAEDILRAVSVGFAIKEASPRDPDNPFKGLNITKAELFETSLVSVGANPAALRISKALGLTDEEKQLIFESLDATPDSGKSADPAILARANSLTGKSAEKPTKPTLKTEANAMKLSERIEAKRTELVNLRDELKTAADTYSEDATEENQTAVETFAEAIEGAEKELATLETAEKSLAAATKPPSVPGIVNSVKNYDKGELVFRHAAAKFIAHASNKSLDSVIKERFPNDKGLEAVIKATDATPAQTTVSAWAGELLEEQVTGFVDLLANNSVYGALRGAGLALNFAGYGTIRIPSRDASPNLAGDFVGEAAPIRVGQLAFSSQTLTPHKMAVISTMTEEMLEASSRQIETIVRQAILDDTSKVLDTRALDNVAGTAVRPAGLLNGVTPTASSGATVANIITDLKALLGPFSTDDAGKNLRILINPQRLLGLSTATNAVGQMQFADEVSRGTLMGIPLVVSANVATDEVHAVNAGEFATASGAPRFSVSNTATLHMEQDQADAVEIIDTLGTTLATPTRSLFQTDTVGIKMILPVTWTMRRASQVSSLSGVAW